jgi:hypothetical protein
MVNTAKNKRASVGELTMLTHAFINVLVYRERIVVVLGTVHPGLGDVQVHAIKPRFWNSHSVIFKRLDVKMHNQLDS